MLRDFGSGSSRDAMTQSLNGCRSFGSAGIRWRRAFRSTTLWSISRETQNSLAQSPPVSLLTGKIPNPSNKDLSCDVRPPQNRNSMSSDSVSIIFSLQKFLGLGRFFRSLSESRPRSVLDMFARTYGAFLWTSRADCHDLQTEAAVQDTLHDRVGDTPF
jgi:hypothetical protein